MPIQLVKEIATTGIEMNKPKKCSFCNKVHKYVPEKATFMADVYWWNCTCDSTLVYAPEGIENDKSL